MTIFIGSLSQNRSPGDKMQISTLHPVNTAPMKTTVLEKAAASTDLVQVMMKLLS